MEAIKRGERVKGKVALVAGAGSIEPGWGNGKAAAVLYAREGAKVFAVDYRPEAAEETRAIIEAEGGVCATFAADVTSEAEVKAMVDACMDAFGRVDILHNNVGGQGPGRWVLDIERDDWDAVLARNVTSVLLTCKAVIPIMIRQGGGAIVNISSIASIRHVNVPTASYSAAKGAVNQLTQNLALQYADKHIRANCVLPGYIDTPFTRRLVAGSAAAMSTRGTPRPMLPVEYRRSKPVTRIVPLGRGFPGWHGLGRGAGSAVPGLGRRRLHHRGDAAGGRRHHGGEVVEQGAEAVDGGAVVGALGASLFLSGGRG